MNRIKIDEKTRRIFEEFKKGEHVEIEKKEEPKNKRREIRKEEKVTYSFLYKEMNCSYEIVQDEDECWNSDALGLRKKDLVNLYEMRRNDPNMFDRMAMK